MIGINWVALGLLLAAFFVMQINAIPVRVRFFVMAAANGAVAALALRTPGPMNRLVAVAAGLFALYYLVKGLRSHSR